MTAAGAGGVLGGNGVDGGGPEVFWDRLGAEGCRALFELIPDVRFFVKNAHGAYIFASRPMFMAHGFMSVADLIGHADREFIPKYLADHYVADDRRVLAGEQIMGRIELVTRHRGYPDWYVTTKTALRSEDGRVMGVFGISRELGKLGMLPGSYAELAPAIECIREQYAESLELDTLARLSHTSLRNFQRRFKRLFQTTPMEYLRQFRVGKACQLLVETNATVATVAAECGFCDHSHLNREFRRFVRSSPGDYRRRYQGFPT